MSFLYDEALLVTDERYVTLYCESGAYLDRDRADFLLQHSQNHVRNLKALANRSLDLTEISVLK